MGRAPRGAPEYRLYPAGQGQLAKQDLSPCSVMGPEHHGRYRVHSGLHQCQEAEGKRTMGRGQVGSVRAAKSSQGSVPLPPRLLHYRAAEEAGHAECQQAAGG